ncbi:hypothetical protein [Tabrizicola sp.]|uniref:hypothetical protein n=1 Tax=Tabrizicola sp. TaxID=2005166 RepID=UPI003F361930
MRTRLSLAVLTLSLGLCLPVSAETVASDCADLLARLKSVAGYSLTAPTPTSEDGWCVLNGATLRSAAAGWPNISAKRLSLRGTEVDGELQSLSVDIGGLRVSPKIGDTSMDDRLRAMFRLQTADVTVSLERSAEFEGLGLRGGKVVLSGGSELEFVADLAGAEFSAGSLLSAAVTMLELTWKNDGRLLRPVMELVGERLVEGASGSTAVDAARRAFRDLVANLPPGSLVGETPDELKELVEALPQGRGVLQLTFRSEGGIGPARLGVAALSDKPLGPEALGRIFVDSNLSIDWQPGLMN